MQFRRDASLEDLVGLSISDRSQNLSSMLRKMIERDHRLFKLENGVSQSVADSSEMPSVIHAEESLIKLFFKETMGDSMP